MLNVKFISCNCFFCPLFDDDPKKHLVCSAYSRYFGYKLRYLFYKPKWCPFAKKVKK